MLLKTLFPTLHLSTAPSGQWVLCNVGRGAAGAGRRGVCATGSATGMLPDCVQTHGVDAPLTVKDQHGLGNSVPSTAKQGAGHNTFATSQRRITAGAVTSVHPQRTGKMGENRSSGTRQKTICWLHVAITGPEKQINESLKCSQQSVFAFNALHVPVPGGWKCWSARRGAPLLSPIFPFYPKSWKTSKDKQGASSEQSREIILEQGLSCHVPAATVDIRSLYSSVHCEC